MGIHQMLFLGSVGGAEPYPYIQQFFADNPASDPVISVTGGASGVYVVGVVRSVTAVPSSVTINSVAGTLHSAGSGTNSGVSLWSATVSTDSSFTVTIGGATGARVHVFILRIGGGRQVLPFGTSMNGSSDSVLSNTLNIGAGGVMVSLAYTSDNFGSGSIYTGATKLAQSNTQYDYPSIGAWTDTSMSSSTHTVIVNSCRCLCSVGFA